MSAESRGMSAEPRGVSAEPGVTERNQLSG